MSHVLNSRIAWPEQTSISKTKAPPNEGAFTLVPKCALEMISFENAFGIIIDDRLCVLCRLCIVLDFARNA